MYEGVTPFNLIYDTLNLPTHYLNCVIDPQNTLDLVAEIPKVSFSGPGWYLPQRDYPKPAKKGGKCNISRLVARKEESSDNSLIIPGTDPARRWEHGDRKFMIRDRGERFRLYLSEVRAFGMRVCGEFGEVQSNVDEKERYMVRRCQERRLCPFCRNLYQRGKAIDLANQVKRLCLGSGLQIVFKPVFTLPERVRDQVETPKQARAFEHGLVEMIQAYFGCPKTPRGTYPKGTVGIYVSQHWGSTTEPWKSKLHFHTLIIPQRIKGKSVRLTDKYIGKSNLREIKRLWAGVVKDVATSLGFSGIEAIPESLVVDWKFVRVLDEALRPTGNNLKLTYDLRCQVQDLQKCVIGVYPGDGSRLMQYEQNGTLYHVKLSRDDYIKEKLRLMEKMRCNTRYGWLRRFKTVAPLLGLEEVIEKDPFVAVPEKTVQVEYRREHTWEWDKERHRPVEKKRMYVKPLLADDSKANWVEIDSWSVHGEEYFCTSKRRYRVKDAADLPSRDRGG
ncbi:hypothetical protein ES703_44179 [subsurface metagenome]